MATVVTFSTGGRFSERNNRPARTPNRRLLLTRGEKPAVQQNALRRDISGALTYRRARSSGTFNGGRLPKASLAQLADAYESSAAPTMTARN